MAFVCENIRTRGFEPRYLEEHISRLDLLSCKYLLSPIKVGVEDIRALVVSALNSGNYSPSTANAVTLQCFDNGELKVQPCEVLYNEFSLRAIRPKVDIYRVEGESILENTSAKEALLDLHRATAQIRGEGSCVPLWINGNGEVQAIDGAPVVAVFDDEVRFSIYGGGVEFNLAYKAVNALHRKATKGAITLDDIAHAKELMYIDYRGITVVDSVENHLFVDIVAEKMALHIANQER